MCQVYQFLAQFTDKKKQVRYWKTEMKKKYGLRAMANGNNPPHTHARHITRKRNIPLPHHAAFECSLSNMQINDTFELSFEGGGGLKILNIS